MFRAPCSEPRVLSPVFRAPCSEPVLKAPPYQAASLASQIRRLKLGAQRWILRPKSFCGAHAGLPPARESAAAHSCSTIFVLAGGADEGASARMLLRRLSPQKYHAARMSIARANAMPSHDPVPCSRRTGGGSFGTASRISRNGSNVMQHLADKAATGGRSPWVNCLSTLFLADDGHLLRRFVARHVGLAAYDDHGFVRRARLDDFAPLVRTANDVIVASKRRCCGAEQDGYGNYILYHFVLRTPLLGSGKRAPQFLRSRCTAQAGGCCTDRQCCKSSASGI